MLIRCCFLMCFPSNIQFIYYYYYYCRYYTITVIITITITTAFIMTGVLTLEVLTNLINKRASTFKISTSEHFN